MDGLPEGLDPNTVDAYDEEHNPLWQDVREPLFVCTAQARNEGDACRTAAETHGKYPMGCLCAFRA